MANTVPITPPRVPLVDPRTGDVSREWYRFFFSLFTITGSASGVFPVTSGGTGLSAIPTDGQLLIGNGFGYALSVLTPGQNIAVGNTPGNITVSFDGILPLLNGGTGADNATDARANLGATIIGSNLFTLPDPSAVTFPRFNADNTVTPLNATDFRSAIGAGTVTSVGGTGTVNGITLTGTVTTSGNLTLGGTLSGVDLTTQVTGVLPIANGGTNATTAADARTNLGLAEYLNPVVNIALTGSPFTYQNVNEYSLDILIGGNVGGVVNLEFSRDNLTWYTTGSFYGQITLSPNDRIRITYVGPPTVTGIPR